MDGEAGAIAKFDPFARIAVLGNSLPRQCGLATFTSHCVDALRSSSADLIVDHYAIGTRDDGYDYPPTVRLIEQENRLAYSEAARDIMDSGAQFLWINHEFGIFGGESGAFICDLVDRIQLPLIVTFHTVLEQPSELQRKIVMQLSKKSGAIMVMANKARDILINEYGIDPNTVVTILHGVPDRNYVNPTLQKAAYDMAGRPILMTFGLLAPDKGINYMIEALPTIVAQHPNVLYMIIGATHPNLRREQGETLREQLAARAGSLGVSDNLRFVDSFLEEDELLNYLQTADVYITPYLNPTQITSGTLSYAIAMGKPVISTPYVHALEAITDKNGRVVPFRDSPALAVACNELLANDELRASLAEASYAVGRTMLWSKLVEHVCATMRATIQRRPTPIGSRPRQMLDDTRAIFLMSDEVGILQHGQFNVADRAHGYCTDDNARALILMCESDGINRDERIRYGRNYAAFVNHAWNPDVQRFRNFMSFDRRWLEDEGSEDSSARALWSLGIAASATYDHALAEWANHRLDDVIKHLRPFTSSRSKAFAILGAVAGDPKKTSVSYHNLVLDYAATLAQLLQNERKPGWEWYEAVLAYDNCRVPEALICAGAYLGNKAMVADGLSALKWIVELQKAPRGYFRGVGNESFGRSYAKPLVFDQQPLEASATIDACAIAYEHTGDEYWALEAGRAFAWFTGANDLGVSLIDPITGSCADGLTPYGINKNSGAESLLSYQLSASKMRKIEKLSRDKLTNSTVKA